MGQRLVIQIEDENGPLANAYYHWSAYTESAAELANDVLGWLDEADKNLSPVQKATWALYKTGARFDPQEEGNLIANNIKTNFEFAFDGREINRNNGLLCVTDEGMNRNIFWEEGRVNIYLDTNEIFFDVMCVETADDYVASKEDYGNAFVPVENLPVLETGENLEFTFNEWDKFYAQLSRILCRGKYVACSPDRKTIYEMIA